MGAEALFWSATALLAWTYVGYPAALWIAALVRPRPGATASLTPSVSVVIAAHDEADCIRQKVDNLLSLDYPAERLEVLVGSDGSTDGTAAVAAACGAPNVRVFDYAERRGKAAVLNDLVAEASGEVLVFADARQRFSHQALRALVSHFAEPAVGAVGGDLVLVDTRANGSEVTHGVSAYWRYEKAIRRLEACVDSTIGVSGAIYALRRELFRPVPEDLILDDVLIPMRATARGYRVVHEPDARAYDRTAPTADAEFARKVRTLAGNFQLFATQPWLLVPWRNRLWLQTVSHKVCRLLGPPALVLALVSSAALAGEPLYAAAFAAQLVFYTGALAGLFLRERVRKPPLLNLFYTFCLLNWATVVAFVRWLGGTQTVIWKSQQREVKS